MTGRFAAWAVGAAMLLLSATAALQAPMARLAEHQLPDAGATVPALPGAEVPPAPAPLPGAEPSAALPTAPEAGSLPGASPPPAAPIGAPVAAAPGLPPPPAPAVPWSVAQQYGGPHDALLAMTGSASGLGLAAPAGAPAAGQAAEGSPQATADEALALGRAPVSLADLQKLILDTAKATGVKEKRVHYAKAPAPDGLERAVLDLYAAMGRAPGAEDRAELHEAAQRLDPRVRDAAALILSAAVEAQGLVQQAAARLEPDDHQALWSCLRSADAAAGCVDPQRATDVATTKVDRALITRAGLLLLSAIEQALPSLQQAAREALAASSGAALPDFQDPWSLVQIGGGGSDVYTGNQFPDFPDQRVQVLTIDLGGSDLYLNTAGGASLNALTMGVHGPAVPGALSQSQVASPVSTGLGPLVSVSIDLLGNDLYSGSFGVQGAGALAVGLMLDLGGDDSYSASSGSQGSGTTGVGLSLDLLGDDVYTCRAECQGVGRVAGLGVLFDASGHDRYEAEAYAQGVGVSQGAGYLVEPIGHDTYRAVAPGPSVSQGATQRTGVGVLADAGGHDSYTLGPSNTGRGYVHPEPFPYHTGIAVFRDKGGVDTYSGAPGADNAQWGSGTSAEGRDEA